MKECTGEAKEKEGEFDEMANSGGMAQKDFIFIRLPVLGEVSCVCILYYNVYRNNLINFFGLQYLERELRVDGLPFPFDLEVS